MTAILSGEVFREEIGMLISCRDETGDAEASDLARAAILAHDTAVREKIRGLRVVVSELCEMGFPDLCRDKSCTDCIVEKINTILGECDPE